MGGGSNLGSAQVFVINVTNIVLFYSSHIGVGALLRGNLTAISLRMNQSISHIIVSCLDRIAVI